MSTNTNNYSTLGIAQFGAPNGNEYLLQSDTTTKPNAPIMAMNPFDPTYEQAMNAFDNYLLTGPNQNNNPGYYYSIGKAYGPPPVKTQAQRSCTGKFK